MPCRRASRVARRRMGSFTGLGTVPRRPLLVQQGGRHRSGMKRKGKAKEFEGKVTGDESRQAEGRLDEAVGKAKDTADGRDAAGNRRACARGDRGRIEGLGKERPGVPRRLVGYRSRSHAPRMARSDRGRLGGGDRRPAVQGVPGAGRVAPQHADRPWAHDVRARRIPAGCPSDPGARRPVARRPGLAGEGGGPKERRPDRDP